MSACRQPSGAVSAIALVLLRLGEADAKLERNRREKLTGLIGIHGPDARQHLVASRPFLFLTQHYPGRIVTACRGQLLRRHPGHRCHPGQCRCRAPNLRVNPRAYDLVPTGDLSPPALADASAPCGLARRHPGGAQRGIDEHAPCRRVWSLNHARTFAQTSHLV